MSSKTENINPQSENIDAASALEIVRIMNQQDQLAVAAVARQLPQIAAAIEAIVARLERGGRLYYVGAGTSGRLGVLDAAECPPTFGVPPELVQAIIAGGHAALTEAVEGAEDDQAAGYAEIETHAINSSDAVVGLSASGTTPFTVAALKHARELGAFTIAVTCNAAVPLTNNAEVAIIIEVGAEVIAGSTRLKAGTAQKLVLNMLSTGTMIRLGFTYRNLMSNLQIKNEKLWRRACEILMREAEISYAQAADILETSKRDLKVALVMVKTGTDVDTAIARLHTARGSVRRALSTD
ncbi:MAG: N-acetylmuramic acid 6-phosphate etherase [Acidobacteriota bacterium]